MADETIFRVVEFTYPCGHSGFQDVRGWSDDEIDQMIDTMTHEPSMCDECFNAYISDDPDRDEEASESAGGDDEGDDNSTNTANDWRV